MPYRDPDEQRRAQRESASRRRMATTGARGPSNPSNLSNGEGGTVIAFPTRDALPRSAADVVQVLAETLEAVRRDPEAGTLSKARTIAYVSGSLLRAIEVAELEELSRLAEGRPSR